MAESERRVIEVMAGKLGSERAAVVGLADAPASGREQYATARVGALRVLLEQ